MSNDCRKVNFIKVSILVVALLVSYFNFSVFGIKDIVVRADESVIVNIRSESSDEQVTPGDIVTVSIFASQIKNMTRFGPLEISYDPVQVDYLSISQPTALSAFSYTVDAGNPGTLVISAVNESVEADLESALMQGYEIEDNSFSSEDEIVLVNISFRVMTPTSDEVVISLEETGDFVNSSKENMDVSIGTESITMNVTAELSSDANLAFLTVNGYTLTPEFSADITDYSISVNRDVNNVQISAIPVNLWASVVINGNTRLEGGENIISIDVTAQDGVSKNTYYIHATKQETYMTEGAGLIDLDGKVYTFVAMPPDYFIPDGFVETTKVINGYSVPVLSREGVESVLVYVSDGSLNPDFYVYNPTTKTVISYKPSTTAIMSSKVLFEKKLPKDVKVPEGFSPSSIYAKNGEIDGYANEDGIFICYMVDENGNGAFYRYNEETGQYSEFHMINKTGTSAYRFFFHLFLFATVIEAVIIVVIVFVVQYNINKRRNPRPKRV